MIQWARTHWPAEKICESAGLCDAAMLSSSQVTLQCTWHYLVLISTVLGRNPCIIGSAQSTTVVACKLPYRRLLSSARYASVNADSDVKAYIFR